MLRSERHQVCVCVCCVCVSVLCDTVITTGDVLVWGGRGEGWCHGVIGFVCVVDRSTTSGPLSRMRSVPVTKDKRSTTKEIKEAATGENTSKSPPPKTYYVSEGNGWKFIKAALDKRGWQQLPFDYNFSTRYSMKWVERRGEIDYKSHCDGQVAITCVRNTISHTLVTDI